MAKKYFYKCKEEQEHFLQNNSQYLSMMSFFKDKNFIVAGGTGQGLGYALCMSILSFLSEKGSLTVLSRDLTRSLEFETGKYFEKKAKEKQLNYYLHNKGMSLEGVHCEVLLNHLKTIPSKSFIYINTVAAASSGILNQEQSPFYVKDIDEEGLFQWELECLSEETIQKTEFIMGSMAIQFPNLLEKHGMHIETSVFSDWRGSLDEASRDPKSQSYGCWGSYSTSLYLPKLIIQKAVQAAYSENKAWMDIFYPIMETRALSMIPGGSLMRKIYSRLAKEMKIDLVSVPILAIQTLDEMHKNLRGLFFNPFPRLDLHEAALDLWIHHLSSNLNDDPKSRYYYSKWI